MIEGLLVVLEVVVYTSAGFLLAFLFMFLVNWLASNLTRK